MVSHDVRAATRRPATADLYFGPSLCNILEAGIQQQNGNENDDGKWPEVLRTSRQVRNLNTSPSKYKVYAVVEGTKKSWLDRTTEEEFDTIISRPVTHTNNSLLTNVIVYFFFFFNWASQLQQETPYSIDLRSPDVDVDSNTRTTRSRQIS